MVVLIKVHSKELEEADSLYSSSKELNKVPIKVHSKELEEADSLYSSRKERNNIELE